MIAEHLSNIMKPTNSEIPDSGIDLWGASPLYRGSYLFQQALKWNRRF